MSTDVVDLHAGDTAALRRSVLRDGTDSDDVGFDGDDLPTTMHLGIRVDGELVAISSWMSRAHPDNPEVHGFQIRGMATEPAHRGFGLAARLLDAGLERCHERGASVVWARARVTALDFYERHGFVRVGSPYVDVATGLLHHDVIRFID